MQVINKARLLHETDAFLIVVGAAGGTGSGVVSILTKSLKEHYPDKPVYNLIVLPFRHEEATEERAIYNTATCLKSAYLVADAIILVDNQRFFKKGLSLSQNFERINRAVVDPFYNLLCAGAEENPKYLGSRTLDAGDIMQTLSGWTAIGYGRVEQQVSMFRFSRNHSFTIKAAETQRGIQALNAALDYMSLKCEPRDAHRALYLLSAPNQTIGMDLIVELNNALKQVAPNARIRTGDYAATRHSLQVAVILSEFSSISRVTDLFDKAIFDIAARKRLKRKELSLKQVQTSFGDIPSLL